MRTDEAIKKDVVDALFWDDRVDAAKVVVTVESGSVTISGTVPTYRARQAAAENARIIRDVVAVDNLIEVDYPDVSAPANEDHAILTEINDRFARDPDIDASLISVTVQQGWATLDGSVATFWHKELAEEVVATVYGVTGITNLIAVVPSPDIYDQTIADKIVAAFDRNAAVDVNDLDVEVADGHVKLWGKVASWEIHDIVIRLATHVSGVTGVEDRLLVRETASAP